jgi:dTDP-6-deoxy-L-talose 4-dehydrogenase (NAD+)
MKIMITGATGFVGRNLIKRIYKKKGWNILCLVRKKPDLDNLNNIKFHVGDIYSKKLNIYKKYGVPDVLIHLAWSGLPNYQENFHLEKNLPNEKKFLTKGINAGIKQIIITGTCFEYGKLSGKLHENKIGKPNTKYGQAKDLLRKYLEKKQKQKNFTLQWVRLFYVFGSDQNPNSLFPTLQKSIYKKEKYFNIAGGKILRDFININVVAKFLVFLCKNKNLNGIINCCSGNPISIRDFVKIYLKKRNSKIKIRIGKFKKPEHEPEQYWGSTSKMLSSSFKFKNEFF